MCGGYVRGLGINPDVIGVEFAGGVEQCVHRVDCRCWQGAALQRRRTSPGCAVVAAGAARRPVAPGPVNYFFQGVAPIATLRPCFSKRAFSQGQMDSQSASLAVSPSFFSDQW